MLRNVSLCFMGRNLARVCAGVVTHACFGKVNTGFRVWGWELFSCYNFMFWATEDEDKILVSLSPGRQVQTTSRCGMVCLPWSLSCCTPLLWQLWCSWLFSTHARRAACTTKSWSEWMVACASSCPWWPYHPVSRIVSPLTFSPPAFLVLLQLCAWRYKPCLGRKSNGSSELVLLFTLSTLWSAFAHFQLDC